MQSRIIMRKNVEKSSFKGSDPLLIKYSLGIDVGKENLDVCLSTINHQQQIRILGTRKFPNSLKGFEGLCGWVVNKKKQIDTPLVCTMEATGVYYENIALYLDDHHFCVSVVLPNRAKQYLRGLGHKSKNDKMDSIGLAQMGAERQLSPWKRPSLLSITLRQTTRMCESSQNTRTCLNNQLEALQSSGYPQKELENMLTDQIALLDKHIGLLKEKTETLLQSDPAIFRKVQHITALKGVGVYTVAVVLAETNFFEEFHSRPQLVSYTGYDVIENQSGKRVGRTRISKKGNAHIRRAMHLPALNVKRWQEPVMLALWQRVYERSKIKMVAYVAVQRKLLLLFYTLWKRDEPYDPQRRSQVEKIE